MRRDVLATLFWPDCDSVRARDRFRQLVRRIRALPWLVSLEAERERVRWAVITDTGRLERLLRHRAYRELVEGFAGDLLEGLDSDEINEFGNWLAFERGRLRTAWRQALFRFARELEVGGQHGEVLRVMEALLARDPLDEEAVRVLLRVGSRAGEGRLALDAYEVFRERLMDDLGLSPSAETRSLALASRTATEATRGVVPVAPVASSQTTSDRAPGARLIGRELELASVAHLLAAPDCRLLTLLGPGGVGKSRIARHAAKELGSRYRDGVAFVPLETLERPDELPLAIAHGLRLTFAGQGEPLVQLVHHISAQHRLVVLDNFEHLRAAAPVLQGLLAACPELDLLLTSRERIGCEEEWLLPIDGLGIPTDEDVSLEDASAFDGVRLFIACAQRVRPHYMLSERDLPHVLNLCRLVGGLPLGLELAAAWLRAMPPAAVAQEIERNLGFLEGSEKPARHRSLRATFEYSWKRLSPRERDAAAKLSVFRGRFTREAAEAVADAPIAVLAALIDRSLIRLTQDGRYDRHPLVHAFTQQKLAADEVQGAKVRDRHAEYFARTLRHLQERTTASSQGEVRRAFELELDDVRVAWRHLASQGRHAELMRLAWILRSFLDNTARYREGIELFERTLSGLDDGAEHPRLAGTLLSHQAWLFYRLGRLGEASGLAERALALLASGEDPRETRTALNVLGSVGLARGEFAVARANWSKALRLSEGSPEASAAFLNNLALAECGLGNDERARKHYEGALALNRRLGDQARIVNNLNNLADLSLLEGDPRTALAMFSEALQTAEALGYKQVIPHLLLGLAKAYGLLGQPREQERHSHRAAALLRRSGERSVLIGVLCQLGRAAIELGKLDEAEACVVEGLELAAASDSAVGILTAIAALAEVRTAQRRLREAASLLAVVVAHPKTERRDRADAQRRLAELEATEEVSSVVTHGRAPQDVRLLARDLLPRLAVRG